MVDETQMYPSSISPLRLLQGIICNIESLKGGPQSTELLGEPKLEVGPDLKGVTSDPSSYHDLSLNFVSYRQFIEKSIITTKSLEVEVGSALKT